MATTRPARSRRMSVSAPRPGPISITVSPGPTASASAMRARRFRSERKCWPRLLRTGGRPEPPRGDTSAPKRDDREVVATPCVARVLVEQREDAIEQLRGRLVAVPSRDLDDLLL